ncbi:MAG: hypothetical protein S0880_12490 [Actinomycetota bacterium]|nr:hypothetical protein [Actinomycetota bacterium]
MLKDIHVAFAWVVVASNAVAGAWALAAHWVEALRTRWLWWFTVVAQLTVFAQVILGVAMVAGQDIESPGFHMFYGFVAIVAVGIIYSYRIQLEPYVYLLYGFGGLFIMGLALRAMVVFGR